MLLLKQNPFLSLIIVYYYIYVSRTPNSMQFVFRMCTFVFMLIFSYNFSSFFSVNSSLAIISYVIIQFQYQEMIDPDVWNCRERVLTVRTFVRAFYDWFIFACMHLVWMLVNYYGHTLSTWMEARSQSQMLNKDRQARGIRACFL